MLCGLAAALFVRLRKRGSMAGRFRAAVACAAQTGKGMPAGRCSVPQKTQPDAVPSQTGFVPAVRDSVNAIVMLCGYVTLFSFFAAIAVPTGADASVRFWATLPLEVTSACRAACETASAWRTQLCCAALSVMGASVFLQVRALLAPRIPLLPLLLSRLLHLPLSLLLFGLLAKLFPMALSVGAQWDASPLLAVRMPPDVMLILFAMAALACGALPVPRYLRRR